MIRFIFTGLACSFILLQTGCQESPHSVSGQSNGGDSLAAAIADSLSRHDPWIKYSFIERQGKRLFNQYCIVCHGQNGEGDGFNAYNLNPRPHSLADSAYIKALSDKTLTEIIAFGGKGVNKSVLMPAYQNTLSKAQISNVVAYIRTFIRNSAKN
jgi:cytochrome c553